MAELPALPAINVVTHFRGHPLRHANDRHVLDCFSDEREIRDRWWDVRPDQVVFDVGASYGSYTLPALACGAWVCAVEPDTWEMAILEAEVQANGFASRCAMVPFALSDGQPYSPEHIAQLHPAPDWLSDPAAFTTLDQLVGRVMFDGRTIFDDLQRLDWIKVDVEGGELAVIQGALSTLERFRPRLILEDHTNIYPWVAEHQVAAHLEEVLRGFGYAIHKEPYHARELWICTPPQRQPAQAPAP